MVLWVQRRGGWGYPDYSCMGPKVYVTTHREIASRVLRVSVGLWL